MHTFERLAGRARRRFFGDAGSSHGSKHRCEPRRRLRVAGWRLMFETGFVRNK